MREIRLSGSEGGAVNARPYPYLSRPFGPLLLTGSLPVSESQRNLVSRISLQSAYGWEQ